MKAKQIEEVLDELKSLRKKVKKATQAQAKVDDKLAQLEALVKVLYQQVEPDGGKKSKKATKKEAKKARLIPPVIAESRELADQTPD